MAYSDTIASETYQRTGLAIESEQDNWRLQPSPVGPALSLEANRLSGSAYCRSPATFCNGSVRRFVDDFPVKDCHLAFHILELERRHCIPIPVPHRNVSFLAFFDYPNLIFKKKLSGRPRSVGTKSSVDIYGFGHSKRMLSINTLQRLPLDGRPEAIARWIGSNKIIGSATPVNSFPKICLKGIQPSGALRAKISRVSIADPPHKRRLRLRVSCVVLVFQADHLCDCVVGRNVGVDNAVPKTNGRFLFQNLCVRIDDPVDGTISDRVRSHVNTGVME